jgi:hypothetical protein
MAEKKFGGATDAAEVLGVSISQFNEMRLRDTHVYDSRTEECTPIDPDRDDLRSFLEGKHLVAPAYAGRRPAGGHWEYNLHRLREYRERGWPGARYTRPETE